ncbi:MAG TPA: HAD hydrolase-like protein [Gemmatimonadaceae bacterium]|nr:HAD hydrolase-like protein [Gemmatimonadaceae bacterium]
MQILRRGGWLSTVVQGVPQLGALVRHMRPTIHLASVAALDPPTLHSLGNGGVITGMIWDVDGTLMARNASAVAPELEPAFTRLLAEPQLRHVILSNSEERRFVELSAIFPGIPVIRVYDGPDGLIVRRRIGTCDSCAGADGVIRRPSARTLRKPSVSLVRAALAELGCSAPTRAVMVGDQYLTDVAPANSLGVRTVKVRTVQPRSFPMAVRVLQAAERALYRFSFNR